MLVFYRKCLNAVSFLLNDRVQFLIAIIHNFCKWLPDELYLRSLFYLYMGYSLDLRNPKTFNEKLNWLKLYNKNPEYTFMVDKYSVKKYVSDIIGPQYVVPTLGVWNHPEDIEWDILPHRFVIKTTHGGGGGGIVFCENKEILDIDVAKQKLCESMSQNIYEKYREWPYKNVEKRVMAETYMASSDGKLKDYKFFCFGGRVKFFKVDFDRFVDHHANYYSREGKLLEFGEKCCPPDYRKNEILPLNLSEMICISEKLSKNIPFVRVDLYNIKGVIYFGELTFFPGGAMNSFTELEWDYKIGEYLQLPNV